jgi:phosphatidate cytidylyltransferase
MAQFSNLTSRVLVAVIAIPVILWLTMSGGYFFFGLVALISAVALYEFYGMAEAKGAAPLKTLGIVAGFLVNAVFIYERTQVEVYQFFLDHGVRLSMFSQHQLFSVVLLVFLLLVLLIELFRTKGMPTMNIATTVLGVLVISLCFGTLIFLRELFPYGFPVYQFFPLGLVDDQQLLSINRWFLLHPNVKWCIGMVGDSELNPINLWGGFTVIAVFASIWICDTAAYFGGKTFGKHLLFERVSPKKTWEGSVCGFVFSVATMIAARYLLLGYLALHQAIILGVLIGVFGQIGDLIESRFKRDAGVKDSSSLIPGHGGVYDRFDSLVYVAPIVYLYIDFVVLS